MGKKATLRVLTVTTDSRRIAKMTLKELNNLGRLLSAFLAMFADCFVNTAGRRLLAVYVKGQLSDVQRKNCETMARKFNIAVRTLQRFLESIKWNEERLRDRCQQIIARDHSHPDAIGTVSCIQPLGD